MPIDEFKTQVLLLHAEQTALDTLSAGFGERYTVHCATSGSEALNTMIDTPINVIISAQDLPGMSGLEALKEAKKRSPDTIGILLAGSGNEAIVGDEEVFQIVHGDVTSDGLKQLVDNATRQLRLMALADSANDTTASPDMMAEHIVMETSENGSTIISDGTGRMPVLDPKKVSAAQSVGARAVDVLVLTKDEEFLETIRDSSRGMHEVHYANTLAEADKAIREHKVGVAVVDAAMVGEKVEQLTQHLRKGSPRLVSIVAGRRDDGEMLMDLINRGKVYRFLLKPVSPGRARLAVEASVKHHLEAPDAAFKTAGKAAAIPASKPAEKPKAATRPKPASRPENKSEPKPAAEPEKEKSKAPKPADPIDPPLGSAKASADASPSEDGLADAFGAEDTSFTETVTGLVSSFVGKSDDKKSDDAPGYGTDAPGFDAPAAAGTDSGSSLLQARFIGIGAAVVVVIAGALFWFMGGSDEPAVNEVVSQPAPSITESDAVFDEAPLGGSSSTADENALLDDARAARDAGQIFNPAGSNAIELFAAALAADPQNSAIAEEFDATISEALGMAEAAMLEARIEDADAALARVAAADADNARLPFLSAQLTQMQLRGRLDEARAAIRENRFEDAGTAITAARALNISDSTEIDTVDAELSEALSAQAVDDVLAQANARLEAGDLLTPANDNARYYYQLALSNDPGNVAAEQGLTVIANKLVLQARGAIDAGNLNAAERLLNDASAVDSSSSDLAETYAALQAERDAIAAREAAEAERLRQAELERERQAELEQQRLEEEARAERERLAAEQAPPADATGADESTAVADGAAAAGETAGDVSGDEQVADEQTTSDTVTDDAGDISPEPEPQAAAAVTAPPEPKLVPVSSLNRVRYVAPKYPRVAQRRNLSGWVDVVFTVGLDGRVENIEIRGAEPGDVFVNAARNAVEKWEFEPVVENGRLVEKQAGVRMMFALE